MRMFVHGGSGRGDIVKVVCDFLDYEARVSAAFVVHLHTMPATTTPGTRGKRLFHRLRMKKHLYHELCVSPGHTRDGPYNDDAQEQRYADDCGGKQDI